jgi:hypothetical protein
LRQYSFNTRTVRDCFRPRCGIVPFRRPRTAADMRGVNVRCLPDADPDAIAVKRVFGSRLG